MLIKKQVNLYSINESVKITNYQIKVFAKGSSEILKDYPETKKRLDPFKQNVLNGICKKILLLFYLLSLIWI